MSSTTRVGMTSMCTSDTPNLSSNTMMCSSLLVAPPPAFVWTACSQSGCGFTIGAIQHKGLHVPVANLRADVLALDEVQEHVRRHLGCVPVGVGQLPAATDMAGAVLGWAERKRTTGIGRTRSRCKRPPRGGWASRIPGRSSGSARPDPRLGHARPLDWPRSLLVSL